MIVYMLYTKNYRFAKRLRNTDYESLFEGPWFANWVPLSTDEDTTLSTYYLHSVRSWLSKTAWRLKLKGCPKHLYEPLSLS